MVLTVETTKEEGMGVTVARHHHHHHQTTHRSHQSLQQDPAMMEVTGYPLTQLATCPRVSAPPVTLQAKNQVKNRYHQGSSGSSDDD